MSPTFTLQIFEPGAADVLLGGPRADAPWPIVERLDRAGIRVLADDGRGGDQHLRSVLRGCSGLVTSPAVPGALADRWPPLRLEPGAAPADVDRFAAAVREVADCIRAYAFFIGRLERDFRHAREALRAAVESEAGIPFLWIDDGRHATNVPGVRERTRLLIEHATFVVADLTLGVESPERENPSRAHEIGMALAYERPLLLCSQEPRRHPYWSIGDMQMTFWATEDELERAVREWIAVNRRSVARDVLNYELPAPSVGRRAFAYDPAQRYVGPRTRAPSGVHRLLTAFGMKLP
jgi:hypothetical protein